MRFFDAQQVRDLLTPVRCIEAMDRAMRATSADRVDRPLRSFYPVSGTDTILGLMPGASTDCGLVGVKVITNVASNVERGLPYIQGVVLVFDAEDGRPLAAMDGAEITAIRTAAASGLATRELARDDARTLGLFGTGVQAASHLDAMRAVRDVKEVLVWGRRQDAVESFCAEQTARHPDARLRGAAAAEAAACDVVCTVTSSTTAVLYGEWIQPGAHLNLVGTHTPEAREVDGEAVARSRVFVDAIASAEREAGDLILAQREGAVKELAMGEIGDVLLGRLAGRQNSNDITLYKSVGLVPQDLFAAAAILESAGHRGSLEDPGEPLE